MNLYIDTTKKSKIVIGVKKDNDFLVKKSFKAHFDQAEKLLPNISNMLDKNAIKLADIKEIVIENRGESFTSLRIGVVTANALAYALKIPVKSTKNTNVSNKSIDFSIVRPEYNREPNITIPKPKIVD